MGSSHSYGSYQRVFCSYDMSVLQIDLVKCPLSRSPPASHRRWAAWAAGNAWLWRERNAMGITAYPLVNQHHYGKSPFFMGKSTINGLVIWHWPWFKSPCLMGKLTISMAVFNSYVKFPEGTRGERNESPKCAPHLDISLFCTGNLQVFAHISAHTWNILAQVELPTTGKSWPQHLHRLSGRFFLMISGSANRLPELPSLFISDFIDIGSSYK